MSIKMTSTNGQIQYNVNEYVVDTPNDLEKIPQSAAMGDQYITNENLEKIGLME